MHVVVLTGMSGSGKSEAARALEDLGFFCVDNLPVPLLARFVELLAQGGDAERTALVLDVRAGEFLAGYEAAFTEIRRAGYTLEVLFLDADDDVLVRRFSESRRRHPLGTVDLRAGLAAERELLQPLRAEAEETIDTSLLSVHELRRVLRQNYARPGGELSVNLLSFGFKYGVPPEADVVFDARFLPNPFFDDDLRPLTGIDSRVQDFVFGMPEADIFVERVSTLLEFLIPLYRREGKSYLTVAVGCTGGRHRSVSVAERLGQRLNSTSARLAVRHRDMERR